MQLNRKLSVCAALGVALLLLVGPGAVDRAEAYPQFQFTTDNSTCNLCHFSPVGGGLINGFGRDESADTISGGGNGGFLHGLWTPPPWFQIGGDYRGVAIVKETTGRARFLGFPMQADLYTRLAFGPISLNTTVGLRGSAREPQPGFVERLWSREHFLMYRKNPGKPYVRIGKFFAPYGLRLHDHTTYVRRFLGNHTLEETYNVSGGLVKDKWELHATAFMTPPFLSVGPNQTGGAVYYERRIRDETSAYGVQAKVALGDEDTKYWVGGVGKLWFEDKKLLVLSELNLGVQTFAEAGDPQLKMVGYLGMTYFWRQGWLLGAAIERYDPDVLLRGTGRDGLQVSAQWFVRAHIELMLMGKVEFQGGDFADPSELGMLMLHYYL